MNVSMTEVATTMRTRFESGGTAPEPADILKNKRSPQRIKAPAGAYSLGRSKFLKSPDSTPKLIFFQHALGRFYSRDNNYRHSADQPRKKQVLEDRQNVVHQEAHSRHCSPVGWRNQSTTPGLLKSAPCGTFPPEPGYSRWSQACCRSLFFPI